MIPYRYNSTYQIVQTGVAVVVQAEMIHDARIIRLDRLSHLPSHIRQWLGDSVGHWEGATLVVDTTNFNDAGGFYGDAGGMYGWDRNMHVVERFSLLTPNMEMLQHPLLKWGHDEISFRCEHTTNDARPAGGLVQWWITRSAMVDAFGV